MSHVLTIAPHKGLCEERHVQQKIACIWHTVDIFIKLKELVTNPFFLLSNYSSSEDGG